MKVLEMHDVHRSYEHGPPVLAGVDLSIARGEVVGLLGANGAGKTTLVRIAMGLLLPQRGSVRVLGLGHATDTVAIKQRVGYVSEEQILPSFLRVAEVLELHRGLFPRWDRVLEARLTERFDLPQHAKIAKLSKGQARQVAVLCAVAHRPELLILDEPAGGLDPAARRGFLEVAIDALVDGGSTILFSSHHMGDVERVAGRIVLLDRGRVLLDRDLDELREEVSLAVLSPSNGATLERLRALEGCLAAREHMGELRAVLLRRPADARALLAEQLGAGGADAASCVSLALEDLFVEAVEGQRR
jgi:ABC-2 type transport system ATP-binding protein